MKLKHELLKEARNQLCKEKMGDQDVNSQKRNYLKAGMYGVQQDWEASRLLYVEFIHFTYLATCLPAFDSLDGGDCL